MFINLLKLFFKRDKLWELVRLVFVKTTTSALFISFKGSLNKPKGKSLWSKFTSGIKQGFKEAEEYGDQTDWDAVNKDWKRFFNKALPEHLEGPVDPFPKSPITGKYYTPSTKERI